MELQERLNRVQGVGSQVQGRPNIQQAQTVPNGLNAKQTRYGDSGGLADLFMVLAGAMPKAFRHLAADKVLEDPRAFLRNKVYDQRQKRWRYQVSNQELEAMLQVALTLGSRQKKQKGISPSEWEAKGAHAIKEVGQALDMTTKDVLGSSPRGAGVGNFSQKAFDFETAGVVSKALDSSGFSSTVSSSGASILVRVDIEDLVYEIYLRKFPAYETVAKIPANGLTHSWNVRTDPGPADVIAELGSVTSAAAPAVDGSSTYARRQTSNIAVIAARRGISLKLQYAIQQSGMGYMVSGTDGLEVTGAITAVAKTAQTLFFQGNSNAGASGGTFGTEDGNFNANACTGLRQILKGATTSLTLGSTQPIRDALDQSIGQIMNAGGDPDTLMAMGTVGSRRALNAELQQFLRVVDQTPAGGIDNNMMRNGLLTVGDNILELMPIPAKQFASAAAAVEGIGHYLIASTDYEDIYVIDPDNGVKMPYLGSPTPVVLELPIAYDNQLSNTYVVFLMYTVAVYAQEFNRKVRIPVTTV